MYNVVVAIGSYHSMIESLTNKALYVCMSPPITDREFSTASPLPANNFLG